MVGRHSSPSAAAACNASWCSMLARHGQADDVIAAVAELNTANESIIALLAARACAIVGRVDPALGYLREAVRLEPACAHDLSSYHEFYIFKDRPEFQALFTQA